MYAMPWMRRRQATKDPDAASVRKVGWRLAALTVALVSVLLLASGLAVYFTTQQALYDSLKNTLQNRALNEPDCVRRFENNPAFVRINSCPPEAAGDVTYSIFVLQADSSVEVVGPFPPDSVQVTDNSAMQQTFSTFGTEYTDVVSGGVTYLVQSQAYQSPMDGTEEVVQSAISEQQYQDSLASLARILLMISGLGILASAAISAVLARRALKPIQVSLRRQRDFVADAAHELRTPLTIMRTAAELGLAEETIAEQQRALEQTLDQNNHLTRLVESLSLLARADSGAIAIERVPVDLSRLVDDSVAAVEMLAEDRDIRLSGNVQSGIQVLGDEGRLRQLLLILLDNALKYTPAGGAVCATLDAHGGTARLLVRDTGPGIDPADLPRLFERFYRADKARSGPGTGLGLAIGRWIAEVHHGRIVAANAPDGGAAFTVTLPLAR